jgi:hypothetical protein
MIGGYFYLYDVLTSKYYFLLFSPLNQDNGIINTQIFNAFNRTFTIKHGFHVQGIFKFDISVDDNLLFRFGMYGDMGSDGDEISENLNYEYLLNNNDLTLYYHHHQELYTYVILKNISENTSQTYTINYDGDNMSLYSNEVTNGLLIYFSKGNNTIEWVINDLELVDHRYNKYINLTCTILTKNNDKKSIINSINSTIINNNNNSRLNINNTLIKSFNYIFS